MKSWGAIALAISSFSAGVYFSDDIKDLIPKNYVVQDGFYERPYDLRLVHIENNGKIETYLFDRITKQYSEIRADIMLNEKDKKEEKCTEKTDLLYKLAKFVDLL